MLYKFRFYNLRVTFLSFLELKMRSKKFTSFLKEYFLFQLAEELLKKETLNYADVEKLLGPPPHGQKRLVDFAEFDLPLKSETNTSEKGQNTNEKSVNAVPSNK